MACCLMAPSHYLNQCWIIVSDVPWHLPEGNFRRDIPQPSITAFSLKIDYIKFNYIKFHSIFPGANEFEVWAMHNHCCFYMQYRIKFNCVVMRHKYFYSSIRQSAPRVSSSPILLLPQVRPQAALRPWGGGRGGGGDHPLARHSAAVCGGPWLSNCHWDHHGDYLTEHEWRYTVYRGKWRA